MFATAAARRSRRTLPRHFAWLLWLAMLLPLAQTVAACHLYSHTSGFHTPKHLMEAYDIWDEWAMWQYAGVEWERRSVPKVYHHGPWKAPRYFGTMDRPLEHNAFNGDLDDLTAFWTKHSWVVR